MILIYIGVILVSICVTIGGYLVVRIAVRDGIDTSTAADWRIVYMREQNKTAGLPQLTSIEDEVARSKYIQNLPKEKRDAEIERFTAYRATKLVRAAHRKRFIARRSSCERRIANDSSSQPWRRLPGYSSPGWSSALASSSIPTTRISRPAAITIDRNW